MLDQIYLGLGDLFPGSDDSLFASSPSKPKVRAKPPTDAASDAWFDAVAYAATKDQLAVVENLLVTGAASGAGQYQVQGSAESRATRGG